MATGEQRTSTLVGLFIFAGLAGLGWLVLQFGRFQNSYEEVYTVKVRFADATGLIEGTSVRLAGVRIGAVAGKPVLESVSPPRVVVPLAIDSTRVLPANAVFRAQSASMLGDKLIVVTIPEQASSAVLDANSIIDGGGPSGLEAIQNDAEALVGDARTVMGDARTMMSDAQTSFSKLDGALDDIRSVTRQLNETMVQINSGVLSDTNISSMGRTLSNVEDASLGARNASADLKPLMVDARKAINQVTELAQRAEGTFAQLDRQLVNIEPAMEEVPETMRSIRRVADKAEGAVGEAEKTFAEAEKTLAKAGQTLDSLNSNEGLVGTLTKDEEVNNDTKTFLKNLRRHGILGYKDEETPEDDPRERYRGRRR